MSRYFWNDATGVNADIERHSKHEKELQEKIASLESIEDPSDFDKRAIATYRHFLLQLQQSKAEVVVKLGKKNV